MLLNFAGSPDSARAALRAICSHDNKLVYEQRSRVPEEFEPCEISASLPGAGIASLLLPEDWATFI